MISKTDAPAVEKMITAGSTFDEIVKKFGGKYHWTDVQAYAWGSGKMSWRGSKKMISTRLKKLRAKATLPSDQAAIDEINVRITYLYNCARALQAKLEAIQKVVG